MWDSSMNSTKSSGKVVDQGVGRLTRLAAVEVARVVLDPLAEAHLLHHLDVEEGALLDALGLQQHVLRPEIPDALPQVDPDLLDGPFQGLAGGDVVGGRVDGAFGQSVAAPRPAAGRSR